VLTMHLSHTHVETNLSENNGCLLDNWLGTTRCAAVPANCLALPMLHGACCLTLQQEPGRFHMVLIRWFPTAS
jgi:hypothetical protein